MISLELPSEFFIFVKFLSSKALVVASPIEKIISLPANLLSNIFAAFLLVKIIKSYSFNGISGWLNLQILISGIITV